jgi:hypothetical protein
VSVAIGVSHCGAGRTIGEIVGTWLVSALGLKLLGLELPAEYVADVTLALTLGIAFQYFSIAPMRGLSLRDGISVAIKADALSRAAFEIGLSDGWPPCGSCCPPSRTWHLITLRTGS